MILDNGSHKNLVVQYVVYYLCLPNTPHPSPDQMGWVHKDGTQLLVDQRCAVTFTIGPFHDIVDCDVSTLDCVDPLMGIPY